MWPTNLNGFFFFPTFFFPLVWQKMCYGSKLPKNPVNRPEAWSPSEGATQIKMWWKKQQGKKVYSGNKHTTQPQTFKAAWLTPKWLSSTHPKLIKPTFLPVFYCIWLTYSNLNTTVTYIWHKNLNTNPDLYPTVISTLLCVGSCSRCQR